MPLKKIHLRPGVVREGTNYTNEGGWFDCDKIRFRSGYPEKIGGWARISAQQVSGVTRALIVWSDAVVGSAHVFIGVGTNEKYYVYTQGAYADITPLVHESNPTDPFAATDGSAEIVVTEPDYTPTQGDTVVISGASSLGGNITADVLNQEYTVASVGVGFYTIIAKDPATGEPVLADASDTGGGGSPTLAYPYPAGVAVGTGGLGWGAGPWNTGVWGNTGASTPLTIGPRLWTHDYFGADLLFAPIGGPIFYWEHTLDGTRAQFLSDMAANTTAVTIAATFTGSSTTMTVPASLAQFLYPSMHITGDNIAPGTVILSSYITGDTTVPISEETLGDSSGDYNFSYAAVAVPEATYWLSTSNQQQFVIAFGSTPYDPTGIGAPFNAMLVRWSDQANPLQWVPRVDNQSGEYQLTKGSRIMTAVGTRQEICIFTDTALYTMQYIGGELVWGFTPISDNVTIISPNAAVTVDGAVYWMGTDKFYIYTGRVEVLPCDVRTFIFDQIDLTQADQVFAAVNHAYSEVWWFYVSEGSAGASIDRYVVYNYLDRVWYYGSMARTAWCASDGLLGRPIAADYNGRVLEHEVGTDDLSGDTSQPIEAFVQSSDFDIDDGQHFGFVWRMLPDVSFNGSTAGRPSVTLELIPRRNAGAPYGEGDPTLVRSRQNYSNTRLYEVQEFTGQVYTRLRGRQMSIKVSSGELGVMWTWGDVRIDVRPDGRR